MASGVCRRPCQFGLFIILFLALICKCVSVQLVYPEISSVKVLENTDFVSDNVYYRKIVFEVGGRNFHNGMHIKATKTSASKNVQCREDLKNYNISEIRTQGAIGLYSLVISASENSAVFLCLPRERFTVNSLITSASVQEQQWFHQGENVTIYPRPIGDEDNSLDSLEHPTHRKRREENWTVRNRVMAAAMDPRVLAVRLEESAKEPSFDDGTPNVQAHIPSTIRLVGYGFSENLVVTFTEKPGKYGGSCLIPATDLFKVDKKSLSENTVKVDITLPPGGPFYICLKSSDISGKNSATEEMPFVHQGSESWLMLDSHEKILPEWASIIIICVCLMFSALFSGLNLGLMSLDRTELKILCNTGTDKERHYANVIQPVRNKGNFLLCSILLGNVFVNSIFTILLDSLTSGVIAVMCSTLLIVMFGEITPQALCSRHGLAVGAKTIYITKAVMVLTFPLAYPISMVLDRILGEEIGNVYNRERLKELVKVTTGVNDLDVNEVNIISGALELRKKVVTDVMTKIEDVFMLDYEAVLDFETVSEIMKSGFSRIPVYQDSRKNIVTMLFIKDLAFVDPDDNTPLKTLCQFYQNPCYFVYDDTTLDVMFKQFKEGHKGHMAFVQRVNSEGEGDPFYETIGLITLEDVIEELIQAEIMDETDVFTDNRSKRRRSDRTKQDFSMFAERRENQHIRISPQLTLATFQYLSTSVDPFKSDTISETILRRMLKQDIIFHIKKNKDWRNDPATVIYQQGKAVDYFVLILEGRVEVTVGKEGLMFESGPFTFLGTQALSLNVGIAESPVAANALGSLQSLNMDAMLRHTFLPDYTVRACSEVLYMKVKRSLYMAAKRATLMERSQKDTTPSDQLDDEVEKYISEMAERLRKGSTVVKPLLHSLEEDDNSMDRVSLGPSYYGNVEIPVVECVNRSSVIDLSVSKTNVNSVAASPKLNSPQISSTQNQPQNQQQQQYNNGSVKSPAGYAAPLAAEEVVSLLSAHNNHVT